MNSNGLYLQNIGTTTDGIIYNSTQGGPNIFANTKGSLSVGSTNHLTWSSAGVKIENTSSIANSAAYLTTSVEYTGLIPNVISGANGCNIIFPVNPAIGTRIVIYNRSTSSLSYTITAKNANPYPLIKKGGTGVAGGGINYTVTTSIIELCVISQNLYVILYQY
jgi:hypothetical protein